MLVKTETFFSEAICILVFIKMKETGLTQLRGSISVSRGGGELLLQPTENKNLKGIKKKENLKCPLPKRLAPFHITYMARTMELL